MPNVAGRRASHLRALHYAPTDVAHKASDDTRLTPGHQAAEAPVMNASRSPATSATYTLTFLV